MTSHTFSAFIEVEPSNIGRTEQAHRIPIAPEKALPRVYHSVHSIADPIELDNLQWSTNVPNGMTPSRHQTHRVPTDLEMSGPTTPQNGVDALQSFSKPPMNRFRMLSVCLMNLGNGLNDSAPGALIPYIEKHYSVGSAVISLVFVTNAIGFISAAFIVDVLRSHLGRAKTLIISQSLMTCGFVAIVCTPPFPAVVISFFFLGLGMAINLAMGNTFAVNLRNGTKMLGAMHGFYGIGGTIGPLIATAMASSGGLIWSRFYFLPLTVTLFNLVFAAWSFWNFEEESSQFLLTTLEATAFRTQNATDHGKSRIKDQAVSMLTAFRSKVVILGAVFIFAYQGAEVSISGWVISFLIATRHGNPSAVGYVTAGFWGGVTLGRFLLSHPAHKVGEKKFVYLVVIGAAVFQLLVWFVPNIIGDAVAVAIVGLFLGPVYPCATTVFSKMIARKDQVSGLSVISAFGSSGGAMAPFTTGILAQAAGTFVLHPIAIGLFAVMLVCWFILPTPGKRTE